jgi:protein-S-isoprenylcysteine O-methyltransferase Ste14
MSDDRLGGSPKISGRSIYGRGDRMRPLAFHEPAAEVLFWTSLATWLTLEGWTQLRSKLQGGDSTRDLTYLLFVPALMASVVVAIVLARHGVAPIPGPAWWPLAAGLTLTWAGMALRVWAVLTLGSFWRVVVVVQQDHHVVDSGPYRWVRHPSYLGILGATVGLGLAEGDWVSLAIMLVCPLIGVLVRIRVE